MINRILIKLIIFLYVSIILFAFFVPKAIEEGTKMTSIHVYPCNYKCDDGKNIQKAIDEAKKRIILPKKIIFGKGNYLLRETLNIPSNVSLNFSGSRINSLAYIGININSCGTTSMGLSNIAVIGWNYGIYAKDFTEKESIKIKDAYFEGK